MRNIAVIILMVLMSGCATIHPTDWEPAKAVTSVPIQNQLVILPKLDGKKITIAVYDFIDKTGQRKPSERFSNLSSTVTQGADVWVIDALQKAGDGTWFTVVERNGLDNLVKERQIIKSTI